MPFSLLSNITITYVMALLAMAFYTLLERKILSYSQRRKGPNKPSMMGIPQPLADAMKLISKETNTPSLSNKSLFSLSPLINLTLMILLWLLYPYSFPNYFFMLSILLFICISSLNIYTTLMAGWASNSKYSLLGAIRSIAQSISYEISMILILLSPLLLIQSYDFTFVNSTLFAWVLLISPSLFLSWFITILAETNRAPFDFAEGESELVSGFNTEFSANLFTLIFMAEYLSIIFISLVTTVIFSGIYPFNFFNSIFFAIKAMTIMILFLWTRSAFPRLRYDQLMNLTWKILLPFSLSFLMLTLPFCSLI